MSSPPDASKEAEANRQRQSNLQRIQQRKQAVRCWPLDKKLEKLAIYSSCKAGEDCKCNGNVWLHFKTLWREVTTRLYVFRSMIWPILFFFKVGKIRIHLQIHLVQTHQLHPHLHKIHVDHVTIRLMIMSNIYKEQ